MNIDLNVIVANSIITNELKYIVGVISSSDACMDIIDTLTKQGVDQTVVFKCLAYRLDKLATFHEIIKLPVTSVAPDYVMEAIKTAAKTKELNEAVNSVMTKSVNKIIEEVSNCADNPQVLKEYLQGLKDNVEDYI